MCSCYQPRSQKGDQRSHFLSTIAVLYAGDLPLFQQFAVAGAAPAPDDFPGLRKPLDAATLSKSPKMLVASESLPGDPSQETQEALGATVGVDRVNSSSSISEGDSISAAGSRSGQGDAFGEWDSQERPSKDPSGQKQPAQLSPSQVENGPTPAAETSSLETGTSFEDLLKQATTVLSMSPSELRAALLQSASGGKQPQPSGEVVGPVNRLDSESPPAPMPSTVTSGSRDQLQLLQDAVLAVARVAAGELRERGKQQEGEARRESPGAINSKPSHSEAAQGESDATVEVGASFTSSEVPSTVQLPAAQADFPKSCTDKMCSPGKTLLHCTAAESGRSADVVASPDMGSPFAGRIAPPSTPDALAYPKGEYVNYPVPLQEAVPHSQSLYLPANQVAWQQFFNNAAASERQRKEKGYLEGQAIAQGQWTGHGVGAFPAYQTPLEYASPAEPLESEAAAGRGLMYVRPNGAFQPLVAPNPSGLMDPVYGLPAPAVSAVRVACPKGTSGRFESGSVGQPRVLVASTHGWKGKSHEAFLNTATTVSQPNAFETPRVDGSWVCCRQMTREGNKGLGKASNH